MNFIKNIIAWVQSLPKLYSIGGAVVLVALTLIGWHFVTREAPAAQTAVENTSHVKVATVADLLSATRPLSVTGKVTSLSQASILAQTSGEITALPHAIGDRVGAGEIIASFENSGQKAAVLQAQGAYDAAEAALARATGSTAENSQTTSITALASAYAALDDAVHARADQLFSNPKTSSPDLIITVPDSALVTTLKSERVSIEATLADAFKLSTSATPENVTANSAAMLTDAQAVRTFLDNLIQAVNETPQSQNMSAATLAAYQVSLAAARTEVVGAMTSVTGAKVTYDSNDLAAAAASVKQAQGALDAAKSNLEKTIVRSPIAGTIVSLPITRGDYVSAFSPVATVSNPNALYVDAQVTSGDAKTIAIGNTATIDGTVPGVITFIAPALDPTTDKIEVKVGLKGATGSLTDGEVVSVSLDRTQNPNVLKANAQITLPIVTLKILPTGPVVFTVSTTSALVAKPVTLGSILGDRIVILSGVTGTTTIVTDARGLSDGQTVVVDPS